MFHVKFVGNGEGVADVGVDIAAAFTISDESWQSWLDEQLAIKSEAVEGGYRLVVMDPLMMMAGDVEENRAQEMTTKIFRPLKELARKWDVAIQMIHHMKKGDPKAPQRGGQMLLGSVANHAWAEDSLYFKLGRGGDILCEQESKNAPVPGFRITGIRNRRWTPQIIVNRDEGMNDPGSDTDAGELPRENRGSPNARSTKSDGGRKTKGNSNGREKPSKILDALKELGTASATELAEHANVSRQSVYGVMTRAEKSGKVNKIGAKWILVN